MHPALHGLAQRLGGRLGFVVVPKWRLDSWPLASHLRDVFARHDIGCVVDVGANTGGYGTFLRQQVDYRGLIVSIEPVRESYEALDRLAKADGNWIAYHMALGAKRTTLDINVTKSLQLCSFLPSDASVLPKYSEHGTMLRTESVAVERFDNFFRRLCGERNIGNVYLKLDTQGWELEVIKGAGEALAEVRALQSELSILPIYKGIPDHMTAVRTISEHGFDVSGMFPVNRDDDLRVIDFDCVMVRRPK